MRGPGKTLSGFKNRAVNTNGRRQAAEEQRAEPHRFRPGRKWRQIDAAEQSHKGASVSSCQCCEQANR